MYSAFMMITSTEWECLIFFIEVCYTTAACHFDNMCQPGAHTCCNYSCKGPGYTVSFLVFKRHQHLLIYRGQDSFSLRKQSRAVQQLTPKYASELSDFTFALRSLESSYENIALTLSHLIKQLRGKWFPDTEKERCWNTNASWCMTRVIVQPKNLKHNTQIYSNYKKY